MNRLYPTVVAAMAAAVFTVSAHANLLGLVVFQESVGGAGPAPPGAERWIYRVYAAFENSNDTVAGWGVGPGWGGGFIQNITASATPGAGFTNVPNNSTGDLAPQSPGTARDWDTYMTIGVLYGQEGVGGIDYSGVTAGTPMFIANGTTHWGSAQVDGSVFLFPPEPVWTQGTAGFRVVGNDTDKRVLLMQLVVNAGEHVSGTLGLVWRPDGGSFTITDSLAFWSVPTPTSIALFVTLLCRNRRRSLH